MRRPSKPRVQHEVSNDGTYRKVEIETAKGGEDKGTVKAQYTVPASAKVFQEMILGLTETPDGGAFERSVFGPDFRTDANGMWKDDGSSPLAVAYALWVNAVDRATRASVYESIAAQSTFI